jgi:DNA-binding transcriptional regulator YhcF (GntR family)
MKANNAAAMLAIDTADPRPIWRQIEESLEQRIATGALAPGEPVASVRDLARTLRVNPATVAKAFQQLVDEQVLYKKRGIGMFVSPTARDTLRAQRRERFFSDVVDPMVAEAKAVGIPIGEVMARIEQLTGREGR